MNYQILACGLWSYEVDEPHQENEEKPFFPSIEWEEIESHLQTEHCGDCVNLPATCVRCYAEDIVRKAKWLADHYHKEQVKLREKKDLEIAKCHKNNVCVTCGEPGYPYCVRHDAP